MDEVRKFVSALKEGDRTAAVSSARALVQAEAKLGDQWRAIAQFAAGAREWSLALAAIERFAANSPEDAGRTVAVADMLAQAGRPREAVAMLEALKDSVTGSAGLHHILGTLYAELGDGERALGELRETVRQWPQSGVSWLTLAGAKTFTADDSDFAALLGTEPRMAGASAAQRAPFFYALGKAWDDVGEHERAFEAFARGAEAIRAERPYDASADRAAAEQIVREFDAGWLNQAAIEPGGESPAIFVTGLPRSGTTLVEQILASHSAVVDGGELDLLLIAAREMGGVEGARARFAAEGSAEATWQPLRSHYLHLLSERFGEPGRKIDKSMNVSRLAGFVRMALPEAPIVWLRRDPLDTAWSCFRTYFAQGLPWSFDMTDIGAHFACEDLLFEHWRGALGERMLVVPYADLVKDSESWILQILAHCGLEPEPGVFEFHRQERSVRTASVAQVRRPIHGGAVGAAAPYARHLEPFTESYEKARAELGLSG